MSQFEHREKKPYINIHFDFLAKGTFRQMLLESISRRSLAGFISRSEMTRELLAKVFHRTLGRCADEQSSF
jgi:hypothetical protein